MKMAEHNVNEALRKCKSTNVSLFDLSKEVETKLETCANQIETAQLTMKEN